jgi:hypothetical protein
VPSETIPSETAAYDAAAYDAVLVLSFGGPEGQDDVIPFLKNVLRGRNVPPERMEAVAGHYRRFGGVSPINGQNRDLITALEAELAAHGPRLPVYWGNRNWHPMLADTVRTMADDGVARALVFVTSAFGSYSGCRQYRARQAPPVLEPSGFHRPRRRGTAVHVGGDRARSAGPVQCAQHPDGHGGGVALSRAAP